MKLMQQELQSAEYILFVSVQTSLFDKELYRQLLTYPSEIVITQSLPINLDQFKYIFLVNRLLTPQLQKQLSAFSGKVCIIATNPDILTPLDKKNKIKGIRYVICSNTSPTKEIVEKIMWFLVTDSNSQVLRLDSTLPIHREKNLALPQIHISKKKGGFFLLILLLFLEFFFIIPLFISSILLYNASLALKRQDIIKTRQYLSNSVPFLRITKSSYQFSRPVLSFFFLALVSDSFVETTELSYSLIEKIASIHDTGFQTMALIVKMGKSSAEKKETAKKLDMLNQDITALSKMTTVFSSYLENIPFSKAQDLRKDIDVNAETLSSVVRFAPFLKSALGGKSEKKYILFFLNNMELRPGGGFIGSFGIVRFKDYTLEELTVYDVYDADGQLTTHVEPPKAISTYLNQTNWFLRDSNFSPDFPQNTKTAYSFLQKEMGLSDFDGSIGITATGIANLLEAFGPLYLPDYKETITKDNFYIKTQLQTEKDFFPGSSQKKDFLSSLMRMMILRLEDVSPPILAQGIQKNLIEKQMVFSFEDEKLQELVQKSGWSGRIIFPQCANTTKSCRVASLFPIDANLGVNKANFFVKRSMNVLTEFEEDRSITQTVEMAFTNNSPLDTNPGGTYKNYFRLFFPQDATIDNVKKDGKTLSEWTKSDIAYFNVFSTYLELAPKTTTTLSIQYHQKAGAKKDLYQLAIQKQIGLLNTNVSLEFRRPKGGHLHAANFSSLEKDGKLLYNTQLSTDKLFLIELNE